MRLAILINETYLFLNIHILELFIGGINNPIRPSTVSGITTTITSGATATTDIIRGTEGNTVINTSVDVNSSR